MFGTVSRRASAEVVLARMADEIALRGGTLRVVGRDPSRLGLLALASVRVAGTLHGVRLFASFGPVPRLVISARPCEEGLVLVAPPPESWGRPGAAKAALDTLEGELRMAAGRQAAATGALGLTHTRNDGWERAAPPSHAPNARRGTQWAKRREVSACAPAREGPVQLSLPLRPHLRVLR